MVGKDPGSRVERSVPDSKSKLTNPASKQLDLQQGKTSTEYFLRETGLLPHSLYHGSGFFAIPKSLNDIYHGDEGGRQMSIRRRQPSIEQRCLLNTTRELEWNRQLCSVVVRSIIPHRPTLIRAKYSRVWNKLKAVLRTVARVDLPL